MSDAGPWIFASVALLSITMLAIRFRGVRLALLYVATFLVTIGVGTWIYYILEPYTQIFDTSLNLDTSAVWFEDLTLRLDGDTATINGRVRNTTDRVIANYTIKVLLFDCPAEGQCDKVGEEDSTENVDIPPRQVRSAEWYVRFDNLPKIKSMQWNYKTLTVVAKK